MPTGVGATLRCGCGCRETSCAVNCIPKHFLQGVLGELRRLYGVPPKPVMPGVAGSRSLVPLVRIAQDDTAYALELAADPRRSPSASLRSSNAVPTHGRWNGGVEPPAATASLGSVNTPNAARIPQRAGRAMRVPFSAASNNGNVEAASSPAVIAAALPAIPPGGYEVVLQGRFGSAAHAVIVPTVSSPSGDAPNALPNIFVPATEGPFSGSSDVQVSAAAAILREVAIFYRPSIEHLLDNGVESVPLGGHESDSMRPLQQALAEGGGVVCFDIPAGQCVIDVSLAPFAEVRWRTLQRVPGRTERRAPPSGTDLSPQGALGLTQDDVDAVAVVFSLASKSFRFGGDERALRAGPPSTWVEAAALDLRASRAIPEHSLLRRSALSIEAAFDRLQEEGGGLGTDAPAEWWERHAGPSMPLPSLLTRATPGHINGRSCSQEPYTGISDKRSSVSDLLTAASARVIRARDALSEATRAASQSSQVTSTAAAPQRL